MDAYDHLEPGWTGLLPAGAVAALNALIVRPCVRHLHEVALSRSWLATDPFVWPSDEPNSPADERLRAAWSAWATDSNADLLDSLLHIGLVRAERSLTGTTWSLHPTMKPESVLRLDEGQRASVRRRRHMLRHADVGLRVYDALNDNFATWPVDCTLETLAEMSELDLPAVRHALEWNVAMRVLSVSSQPMVCARTDALRISAAPSWSTQ